MTQFQVKFIFSMSILLLISVFSVLGAAQKSTAPIGQDPKCLLPLEVGPCSMKLDRFYYNAKTNACEQFKFGGCRGNDNKFGFRKTCEDACLRKSPSVSVPPSSTNSKSLPTPQVTPSPQSATSSHSSPSSSKSSPSPPLPQPTTLSKSTPSPAPPQSPTPSKSSQSPPSSKSQPK